MTFEQVLPKLRLGAHIARMRWPEGVFIYPSGDYIFLNRNVDEGQFKLGGEHIFADDWYVYSDGDKTEHV